MIKLKEFFIKYHLIFLGFLVISLYFWNRFLRSKTTKYLPFNLTVFKFFLFSYVCCIFAYIIFSLIFSRNKNVIIENIIDWIFTPIKELEKYLRTLPIIKRNYENIFERIFPTLELLIINTDIFYIIFWIFPRLILLTALFLDVFMFHQFHYKYQVILFGLLLFFNRCFKYSLKNIKEEKIQYLSLYVKYIYTNYSPGVHPSELAPDYDPEADDNDDYSSRMTLPLDIFIKYQTESMVYLSIHRDVFFIGFTQKANEEFWKKYVEQEYVLFFNCRVPETYKNKFDEKVPDNYTKAFIFVASKKEEFVDFEVTKIMKISILLEHLNITNNSNDKIKYMKILIYLNYLLCWLYVLIISLPTLNVYELMITIIKTWIKIKEPFSDNDLFDDI